MHARKSLQSHSKTSQASAPHAAASAQTIPGSHQRMRAQARTCRELFTPIAAAASAAAAPRRWFHAKLSRNMRHWPPRNLRKPRAPSNPTPFRLRSSTVRTCRARCPSAEIARSNMPARRSEILMLLRLSWYRVHTQTHVTHADTRHTLACRHTGAHTYTHTSETPNECMPIC